MGWCYNSIHDKIYSLIRKIKQTINFIHTDIIQLNGDLDVTSNGKLSFSNISNIKGFK